MSTTALTLYQIEDRYLALVDTEAMVGPEQEEEFRSELSIALQSAVAKRDRVAQFILACRHHEDAIDTEIKRLQALKKSWCTGRERMEKYVCSVIEGLGTDAKGKFKPLKGEISTLTVRRNPAHVEITDESSIPAEYKKVVMSTSVDKSAIKAVIESGNEVPGADLAFGNTRLEVR